jgi:hypothetical protein
MFFLLVTTPGGTLSAVYVSEHNEMYAFCLLDTQLTPFQMNQIIILYYLLKFFLIVAITFMRDK